MCLAEHCTPPLFRFHGLGGIYAANTNPSPGVARTLTMLDGIYLNAMGLFKNIFDKRHFTLHISMTAQNQIENNNKSFLGVKEIKGNIEEDRFFSPFFK